MARGLPSASLYESARFNQAVIVPNALQGLFKRRPTAVGIATRAGVDGQAIALMSELRNNHAGGPLWIRVMTSTALLMLEVADVRRVLEASPRPFAPDPEAKRKGMSHFQPDALTISRDELWSNRRRFTEAVLDPRDRVPPLADRFVAVVEEEISALLAELPGLVLDHDALHRAMRRVTRRIILGDRTRDDEELSDLLAELMSEANGLPSGRSEHYAPYMARLSTHVDVAPEGSLASRFAAAPQDADTCPAGQVTHWLFALQDTLTVNVLRALVLIAAHPDALERADAELLEADLQRGDDVARLDWLRACLQDTMRLYPTTPLLSRETLVDLSWEGAVVPAGTQVLIVNAFHHRDPEHVVHADSFAPEEWIGGQAAFDWSFNHFSHGPQGCPGVNLALLVGGALLGQLLLRRRPVVLGPRLDPAKPLPHMLNPFGVRIALG